MQDANLYLHFVINIQFPVLLYLSAVFLCNNNTIKLLDKMEEMLVEIIY